MPANFLHGVEIVENTNGPVPITVVKSSVIGLVGSAPRWAVPATNPAGIAAKETPTLVSSQRDASMFGPLIRGYSIPYALNAIQQQGAGQAIVIDVFEPTLHNTAVASAPFTFPATGPQVINLGHMGIVGPGLNSTTGPYPSSVVVKNQAGTTTYVENTDYTVDYINGLITAKTGGAITAGEAVTVSYAYCDPSKVADSDLVGAVTNGVYTGIQALQTTYGTMGFFAKILIAPAAGPAAAGIQSVGSDDPAVQAALLTMAATIRAMALIDTAPQTTPAQMIANRGVSGNAWDTSSNRAILCGPWENFEDIGLNPTGVTISSAGAAVPAYLNATEDSPYSPWVAGAMAAKDLAKGYWWSPSNTEITGVLGPDVMVYASPFDPNSDTNNLNAAGIVTVYGSYATGLRVWGNRSAEYPSSTYPDNFIPIRRTMDVVEESAQLAMMQFLDRPLTSATIDSIVASVNQFIRTLVGRGALIDGLCSYNAAENPVTQLAAGQLVLDIQLMPPPPLERLTFNVTLNVNYLSELSASTSANTQAQGALQQPGA